MVITVQTEMLRLVVLVKTFFGEVARSSAEATVEISLLAFWCRVAEDLAFLAARVVDEEVHRVGAIFNFYCWR